MEKSTKTVEQTVQDILTQVSDALQVPVNFAASEADANVVRPTYNPDAMVSKLLALLVYSGISVPSTFAPAYNRVHADIEFWKNYMVEQAKTLEIPPPAQPQGDQGNGTSESQ